MVQNLSNTPRSVKSLEALLDSTNAVSPQKHFWVKQPKFRGPARLQVYIYIYIHTPYIPIIIMYEYYI